MTVVPEGASLEDVRAFFSNDRFAAYAQCRIEEAARGRAVCTMPITEGHCNAMGNVMGGAVFTLADYALAIACNVGEEPSVSIESDIKFLTIAHGDTLTATAMVNRSGRHVGVYTIVITDSEDREIAIMTATVYR